MVLIRGSSPRSCFNETDNGCKWHHPGTAEDIKHSSFSTGISCSCMVLDINACSPVPSSRDASGGHFGSTEELNKLEILGFRFQYFPVMITCFTCSHTWLQFKIILQINMLKPLGTTPLIQRYPIQSCQSYPNRSKVSVAWEERRPAKGKLVRQTRDSWTNEDEVS